MAIDNILDRQALEWICSGKSVGLDLRTGVLKLNSFKDKITRFFCPQEAMRQDIAVARRLIETLKNLPSGVNGSSIKFDQYVQEITAGESFVRDVLSGYRSSNKNLLEGKNTLQYLLDAVKVCKAFGIPYSVAKEERDFVAFALTNHLHRRIDKSYQEKGLGVKVVNGQIQLPVRVPGSENHEYKSWRELTCNSQGKIVGWELMAYGWQPYYKDKCTELEPVKIIPIPQGSKPQYSVELVTARPSYNLKHFGLGMFGHSWLRVYAPLKDERGEPTGELAVYSLGYNLETIVVPDIFEFIDREQVSCTMVIDESKFFKVKERIAEVLEISHGYPSSLVKIDPAAKERAKRWLDSNCVTCGTFSSKLYEEFTGLKVDGRLLFMKVFFPEKWNDRITKISSESPSWIKEVLTKIKMITHGYFPGIMANRLQKHLSSNVMLKRLGKV